MKQLFWFLAIAIVLIAPVSLSAQGCALCYTQAAGAGMRMIAALKSGILVLVFPPMGICVMLTWMGYRKRNRFHSIEQEQQSPRQGPNSDLGW
jgi:hypothetical protein